MIMQIQQRITDELPVLLVPNNHYPFQEILSGYKIYRCRACHCIFNERTDTPFNHLRFPTYIVLLVGLWRIRYSQGNPMRARRDLAEMFPSAALRAGSDAWLRVRQGSASAMRSMLCAIGNDDLPRLSQRSYAPDDGETQADPGTWTKHISGSGANGATFTEPLTEMPIWLIPCSRSIVRAVRHRS